MAGSDLTFSFDALQFGGIRSVNAPAILPLGRTFVAKKKNARLLFQFASGALRGGKYLVADLLINGSRIVVFRLALREGAKGRRFDLAFSALPQCQARLRMPLEAVAQNRWLYPRQGALLKPMCFGDRVDLDRVDRMELSILRKAPGPVRWCMTPLRLTRRPPKLLNHPLLPRGPLLDELGQLTLRRWPGKSRSAAEVDRRLKKQAKAAKNMRWPAAFSRCGGDAGPWGKIARAGGFFATHYDGRRWWLVDPEGRRFWSSGIDCVIPNAHAAFGQLHDALVWRPPERKFAPAYSGRGRRTVSFLIASFIRAFGARDWKKRWADNAYAHLRQFGFNTVGNWSDTTPASARGFPYVRPLNFAARQAPSVFRDFPDVFHPGFTADAAEYARQLRSTAADPAMIGYFLMNEPTWGFANMTPAAGMLFNTAACASRAALAAHLRARYGGDAALARAWGMPVTLAQVRSGKWTAALTAPARIDLENFSTVMVARLFNTLVDACKKVDGHHLNLGTRYHTVPPDWALLGMTRFDVFSVNAYRNIVPKAWVAHIGRITHRPTLIGEWHFGALDVGLPASGIGRVRDQAARGQAFRVYCEQAAANPWCVGVHYFILYDQSALGRGDGENYNIGFLDTCNRPYSQLARAARQTHQRLYRVADGQAAPYSARPAYLSKLFM